MKRETVILSAYREAVLAAHEKGIKGPRASLLAVAAAARLSTKLLDTPISEDEVRRVIGRT